MSENVGEKIKKNKKIRIVTQLWPSLVRKQKTNKTPKRCARDTNGNLNETNYFAKKIKMKREKKKQQREVKITQIKR